MGVSRQRTWQLARKAAGLCTRCGKRRDGATVTHCSTCRKKIVALDNAKRRARGLKKPGPKMGSKHAHHRCSSCGRDGHNSRTCVTPAKPGT